MAMFPLSIILAAVGMITLALACVPDPPKTTERVWNTPAPGETCWVAEDRIGNAWAACGPLHERDETGKMSYDLARLVREERQKPEGVPAQRVRVSVRVDGNKGLVDELKVLWWLERRKYSYEDRGAFGLHVTVHVIRLPELAALEGVRSIDEPPPLQDPAR